MIALREITGAALGVQISIRRDEPSIEKFEIPTMLKHHAVGKPHGGFWTSTIEPDGGSGWTRWCETEQPDWLEGRQRWLLTPDPAAKILEISCSADLTDIVGRYQFERYSTADYRMVEPDYEAILSDGYAGVHLTESGLWATRMTFDALISPTYSWDCESTVWLRYAFAEIRREDG